MAPESAPSSKALRSPEVVRLIGSYCFGTAALGATSAAVVLALQTPDPQALPRRALIAALLVFAAACLLAWSRSRRATFDPAATLFAVSGGALLLIGVGSLWLQQGVRSPALGVGALLVCLLSAITRLRDGVALAVLCGIQLSLLAGLEATGWAAAPAGAVALPTALLLQSGVLVGGLAGGALISRVLGHVLRSAKEREQRFRRLLDIAADWYWELDAQFRFTRVSEAVEGCSGLLAAERLGRTPWQIRHFGLDDAQLDAHRADLESHRPFANLIVRRTDARAQVRFVSVSGEPQFGPTGAFIGYWGVGRDISEQMHAQMALAASETRYSELFSRSPSALVLHRSAVVIDANDAAARLFGYADAAALRGTSLVDRFLPGEHREQMLQRLAELELLPVGAGLPVRDYKLVALNGARLSVQATGVQVETHNGPATLSIFFDITARMQVEQALRRSEAMLQHLFDTSPDVMTLTEADSGRLALVNDSFTRVTGHAAAQAVGRDWQDLGLWREPLERERLMTLLLEHGSVKDFHATLLDKSGAPMSLLLSAARFVLNDKPYLVINGHDITESERDRLEQQLILERASIGIAFTRDRQFVRANARFERIFGWAPGALVGQPGQVVWPSEEDYAEVGRIAAPRLAAGQSVEMERRARRHDGSEFWCRLMAQVVDRSDPTRSGTVWIAEDVTERRQIEQALATARDAAESANRAKSAFLANTSHEIRTPLNGLLGLTRLAMQRGLNIERREQYLRQILDSAESLAGIISDILDLSKIEAGKMTLESLPFDLRGTLVSMQHAYESLAEAKGLQLSMTLQPNLPDTVRGDPVRLRQILSNFITNALKFTEHGRVSICAGALPDGWVRLCVEDTGPGIASETQARLFQPFSQADASTTRRYGGSGLGLSICRELAQLMGGRVGVDSRPGAGSIFWAELPLPAAEPGEIGAVGDADELDTLRGTHLLVVEDNPVNMMIAVAMLEGWGIDVAQALNGQEAIDAVERAARSGRPFDLVLMDVHMPVMNGYVAVRTLRQRHDAGRLPVIALTAAALVSEREEALAAGMNDFLTKPIDPWRLRKTLASHLRRTAPA